jgi:hypothetical protein
MAGSFSFDFLKLNTNSNAKKENGGMNGAKNGANGETNGGGDGVKLKENVLEKESGEGDAEVHVDENGVFDPGFQRRTGCTAPHQLLVYLHMRGCANYLTDDEWYDYTTSEDNSPVRKRKDCADLSSVVSVRPRPLAAMVGELLHQSKSSFNPVLPTAFGESILKTCQTAQCRPSSTPSFPPATPTSKSPISLSTTASGRNGSTTAAVGLS